ncbi:MAG: A/G-specific adenine glycosylase [Betaproteobacteria bacterium]|nr:A/G-specific adenine glycosylase [Betaproteobacteria bacterium]
MSAGFAAKIVAWQKKHGRHDLPWQGTRDPYRIWLAETMLQQTQVATVIPYYNRFLARFPDVAALVHAPLDEVLRLWSGLGYYSRARNLHGAAHVIAAGHGGRFPRRFEQVAALPGVGRSTAAAICVFAYGARHAILDGNVRRVLARFRGIQGFPGEKTVADRLWAVAERLLPRRNLEAYTQGLMDLGATVCTRARPRCAECPVHGDCVALRRGRVARLPAPRPRKPLPRKRTIMLVLTRAGEVLLEKRPAAGIWGGMWCLPEAVRNADIAAHCLKRFGVRVTEIERLPQMAHGFTHFKLNIQPLRLRVSALVPHAAEPGVVWLPLEEARGAAIPAPVRRILAAL